MPDRAADDRAERAADDGAADRVLCRRLLRRRQCRKRQENPLLPSASCPTLPTFAAANPATA
jgi:hypothetical protein